MKIKLFSIFVIVLFLSCKVKKNEKITFLQGYIAWQQKNWNYAASYFLKTEEIASRYNKDLTKYVDYALASTYLMQNENEAALEKLTLIEEKEDNELSSSVFYQLGIIAFKGKKYKEALLCFRKSLEKDPTSLDAKINYELSKQRVEDEIIDKVRDSIFNEEKTEETYNALVDFFRKKEIEKWEEKNQQKGKESTYDY